MSSGKNGTKVVDAFSERCCFAMSTAVPFREMSNKSISFVLYSGIKFCSSYCDMRCGLSVGFNLQYPK